MSAIFTHGAEGIVQIATPHLNLSFIGNKEDIAIFIHFVGMNELIIAQCHLFGLSNTIIQKAKYQTADAIIKGFCGYFHPDSRLWRRSILHNPLLKSLLGFWVLSTEHTLLSEFPQRNVMNSGIEKTSYLLMFSFL